MKTGIRVAGLLVMATTVAVADMRTWTFEKTGTTMEAELVGFAGENATMKLPDGKVYTVPIAYLVASNRVYLAEQRSKLWKDVEVVKLLGEQSIGRYKRCTVRQGDIDSEILVELLPPPVEAILTLRQQQETEINNRKAMIDADNQVLKRLEAQVRDANMLSWGVHYFVRETDKQAVADQQDALAKLEQTHTDYVNQTKGATFVKMKDTGFIYDGLAVWECADPRKPQ